MKDALTGDRALMTKLAAGQASALDELYRKHAKAVAALLRGRSELSELGIEIEDLVQETFKRVSTKAALYRRDGNVLAWILKIAKNIALNAIRAQKRRRERETNYAIRRAPQGGEAAKEEWEKDKEEDKGNGEYGYVIFVFPAKRTGRNPLMKVTRWLRGVGEDSVRGLLGCFGLVPVEQKIMKIFTEKQPFGGVIPFTPPSLELGDPGSIAIKRCSFCGKRRTCSAYGSHFVCGVCERFELRRKRHPRAALNGAPG